MNPPDGKRGTLRPLSVAPMMARTDRHYRFFMRQLTKRTLLYTEMVTMGAVLHGDRDKLLGFTPDEKPLALQLGGDDPAKLARCARVAEELGYDEVNLNVGCPSERVQSGNFGACLMAEPQRVADAVSAMRQATGLPVTVKHRIGIDHLDRYEDMLGFVATVAEAGCDRFSVHARKAWLSGLSPKENRNVPPLRYADVHRLKRDLPRLEIEINGGFRSIDAVIEQLRVVDAVMIGRAAYETPYVFATADRDVFGDLQATPRSRFEVVEAMLPYVAAWTTSGTKLHKISRHMLTLFAGQPGTRAWKRHLSTHPAATTDAVDVLRQGLELVEAAQAKSRQAMASTNGPSAHA